ncbi:hypothetical protein WJX73_002841 [Symbiochloris irregularis]|uniref:Uncharacterized protein n=1 Tax=Symbiochloris irregularis TaxID=706552 RepID=A0AAW1NM53_9CHLO
MQNPASAHSLVYAKSISNPCEKAPAALNLWLQCRSSILRTRHHPLYFSAAAGPKLASSWSGTGYGAGASVASAI